MSERTEGEASGGSTPGQRSGPVLRWSRLNFGVRFGRLALAAVSVLVAAAVPVPPTDAPGDFPLQRIGFGSCLKQEDRQPVWDAIGRFDPQLFLFLGDNVYADTTDMEKLKADYARLGAQPGFGRLRSRAAVMATWDDHDYGRNDAGDDYRRKAESKRVFMDFWGEGADSPRRSQPGVYSARVFGPPGRRVQVILLDLRYNRSGLKKRKPWDLTFGPYAPDRDPKKTFLGAEQWKWFREQLLVPADLRLVGSSIQVIAEGHDFEKWGNFPLERARLFDLFREANARGVVILSGDRHFGELSTANAGIGYPLYDLTSSGMNTAVWNLRPDEPNDHRVGLAVRENNFGSILLDWEARTVTLQIRSEDGMVRLEKKVPLSDLAPKKRQGPG